MAAGRVTLERVFDLTAAGAVRLFGRTAKGRIAPGFDADFSVVDLKSRWTVENAWLQSKCGWSPFEGTTLTGRPVGTIIRGRRVMWDAGLIGTPIGAPFRFDETIRS